MKITKFIALATVFAILFSVTVSADYNSSVKSVTVEDNVVTSADIVLGDGESGTFYAAVYENGILKDFEKENVAESGIVKLNNILKYDEETQILKCFLWDDMQPLSLVFDGEATNENSDKFAAVFATDAHSSINVCYTQDFETGVIKENALKAYARDSDTGDILTDGNGQINFEIIVDDGYEVDEVSVTPENYKNLKNVTGNIYRITKVTGNITLTVTTKEKSEQAVESGVINLLGNSINADGVNNVTLSGTTATISAAGTYIVKGTLDDGQLAVDAAEDAEVIINLNGVSITNSSDDAFKAKSGKITLVAAADTENTFTAEGSEACGIYSKQDLTIKSDETGKITAVSKMGNGIRCKKDIEIGAGNLAVNAAKNGIKGDKSVKITKKNNSVTVISDGDGIKTDLLPETDADTNEYISGGTITINGGNISIAASSVTDSETGEISNGDGIQADSLLTITGGVIDINAKGEALKANASSIEYLEDETVEQTPSDGDGRIIISGGTIAASAGEDGIKAVKSIDISGGDITIAKSQEGIQVNEAVYNSDGTEIIDYVEGEINISGGTINITSSEDGIQCGTGNITISDENITNITIDSDQDCIQADYIMNITGGEFNLTAHGGANAASTSDSCKGIKAGLIVNISGGTFDINSYDDAIHSNNTVRISGGDITAATSDDGIHGDSYLFISGDAKINITKSYEGIEAAKIYISGGETYVVSSDDGANAAGDEPTEDAVADPNSVQTSSINLSAMGNMGGWNGPNQNAEDSSSYGYLEISGGLLYIEAEGDGFDSNGDGIITGGVVLVNGPTSGGNGVFDVGDNNNTLMITGGIVIGAGSSDMAETPSSSANSQYYIVTSSSSSGNAGGGSVGSSLGSSGISTQSAGKAFKVTNSSGEEIVTYVPSKSYSWVLVSTPEMTSGSYTLSYGGNVSGGSYTKDGCGIATGGNYSGGSSVSLTAKK